MSEGDTIFALSGRLHRAVAGKVITRSDVRVPRYATTDLRGDTFLEVTSHGKHLLMRTTGGITIHSHLQMEGRWDVRSSTGPVGTARDDVRMVIDMKGSRLVGIRLAQVAVVPTRDEASLIGSLGPDPLRAWDLEDALARVASFEGDTISDLLLEQRVVAGFGNIYRNEICFLRGIWPWERWDAVDVRATLSLGARILQANKDTARHITTGIDRPGQRHWVYGRWRQPCSRCRTPIDTRNTPAERVTYWCSHCQPKASNGLTGGHVSGPSKTSGR